MVDGNLLDYSVVDFYDAKKTLEDFVNELAGRERNDLTIYAPSMSVKNSTITINHFIESGTYNQGRVIDVIDLFFEYYPGRSSFQEKGLSKFMGEYRVSHSVIGSDNKLLKKITVGPAFSKGKSVITNNEVKHIGPHVSISFEVSNYLDKRDLDFNMTLYKMLVPKEEQKQDLSNMRELGCIIYDNISDYGWDYLAGYEKTKREIENKLVRPNLKKDIFKMLREGTRKNPSQVGYNCFMFTGTYGVGKTDMAKVVANRLGYNFVELPLEAVMTKWYGESEKILGKVFERARTLGPTVLFLDEIDCLAGDRDSGMHEATKRIMSVLMTNTAKTKLGDDLVVIAATNKPDTIDGGLMRRFKKRIDFPVPEHADLCAIYRHYAKHLDDAVIEELASKSEGFSPFDILNVCNNAEDFYVESIADGEKPSLPGKEFYMQGIEGTAGDKAKKKKIGFAG